MDFTCYAENYSNEQNFSKTDYKIVRLIWILSPQLSTHFHYYNATNRKEEAGIIPYLQKIKLRGQMICPHHTFDWRKENLDYPFSSSFPLSDHQTITWGYVSLNFPKFEGFVPLCFTQHFVHIFYLWLWAGSFPYMHSRAQNFWGLVCNRQLSEYSRPEHSSSVIRVCDVGPVTDANRLSSRSDLSTLCQWSPTDY